MNPKKKKTKTVAGKPNGNAKRLHLRTGNRAYNAQLKVKTKGKRRQLAPPGTPNGKHISTKGSECRCGGCLTGSNQNKN